MDGVFKTSNTLFIKGVATIIMSVNYINLFRNCVILSWLRDPIFINWIIMHFKKDTLKLISWIFYKRLFMYEDRAFYY